MNTAAKNFQSLNGQGVLSDRSYLLSKQGASFAPQNSDRRVSGNQSIEKVDHSYLQREEGKPEQSQMMEKWTNYRDNIRKKMEQVHGTILIED
mmetsp:Transcript_10881/g.11017  ORF Transcript_10881/g.11017 Transcript_10881/m.11017 type:complete len:93 (+) Transcript_10881:16-294(+)